MKNCSKIYLKKSRIIRKELLPHQNVSIALKFSILVKKKTKKKELTQLPPFLSTKKNEELMIWFADSVHNHVRKFQYTSSIILYRLIILIWNKLYSSCTDGEIASTKTISLFVCYEKEKGSENKKISNGKYTTNPY